MAALEERRADSNTLLRAVIDTTVDGMVVIDRGGQIRIFNPALASLFGYAAEEVVGRNISVLMPQGDANGHDSALQTTRESDITLITGIGREVEGRRKDGSRFPMYLAVGEIKDGEEFAYVGVVRDLTDEKRGIAALVEARLKAEFASHAKSEFLARMSHELRTPMNAILGFAQLSRMLEPKLSAEQRMDYLDSIIVPAQHLTGLIDDILDLSSIEAGRVVVLREEVNLFDAVTGALTMTQPLARRLDVAVFNTCMDRDAAPIVLGDALRLRQCIVNLLSNAIKYSHAQGRVLIVWSESDEPSRPVRLTIQDSGVGIPESQMDDLFRPFTRLHPTLEHIEGAGIGLAMTRELMDAMGGEVSAESGLGLGSRFHLDLPRSRSVKNRNRRGSANHSDHDGGAESRPAHPL
jgi:PAS domain S-box-containing protein